MTNKYSKLTIKYSLLLLKVPLNVILTLKIFTKKRVFINPIQSKC